MKEVTDSASKYLTGDYKDLHPDWHAGEAPLKARDLHDLIDAVLSEMKAKQGLNTLRIADVGAGVGLVLLELKTEIEARWPSIKVVPIAFEISPEAVALAKVRNPTLDIRQKMLAEEDGPFDVVMFVDVLEHVENPWELLRTANSAAEYLIVRQPLLGNYSRFRHDNYGDQRRKWGHIGYFTYRSFLDMAAACGWEPIRFDLLAPWELATDSAASGSVGGKLLLQLSRVTASFFVDGFYLNGAFRRSKASSS